MRAQESAQMSIAFCSFDVPVRYWNQPQKGEVLEGSETATIPTVQVGVATPVATGEVPALCVGDPAAAYVASFGTHRAGERNCTRELLRRTDRWAPPRPFNAAC